MAKSDTALPHQMDLRPRKRQASQPTFMPQKKQNRNKANHTFTVTISTPVFTPTSGSSISPSIKPTMTTAAPTIAPASAATTSNTATSHQPFEDKQASRDEALRRDREFRNWCWENEEEAVKRNERDYPGSSNKSFYAAPFCTP